MRMEAEEVVEHCSLHWQEVKSIQSDLQRAASKPFVNDEPLLQVLQETEKRLKAELEGIKKRELSVIPQNKEMQALVVNLAEQHTLHEYKEELAYMRATRADIVESLKKSEAEFSQLQQLNNELRKKLSALQETEQEKTDNTSLDTVLTDMKAKVEKVGEVNHFFKRALKNILTTRCPPPNSAEVKRTLNESQDVDPNQVMDIKRIIGKLFEQTLNSPEQPYVELDHRIWPAHVEFLIQCQVAVQHPDHPNKIKLVPFHL